MTTPKNYIGEWFGCRVYPTVKCGTMPHGHFTGMKCPFLSAATQSSASCVKNQNSKGVCTITSTTNGIKDWMVCPYRALDDSLMKKAIACIFGIAENNILPFPVTTLENPNIVALAKKAQQDGRHVFIYFQQKLGGEINVGATDQTPELSFDLTLIPVTFKGDLLLVKRYGIYEVQTMDFHGSYLHAVQAVSNALDLHKNHFASALAKNSEWLGRSIEGPNIANVFKRTFYQVLLKFGLAGQGDCAGVVLGLPSSVWESWRPHLAAPEIRKSGDTYTFKSDRSRKAKSWILVFENDTESAKAIEPLYVKQVINVSVPALLKAAFHNVPQKIAVNSSALVRTQIVARIQQYYKAVQYDI